MDSFKKNYYMVLVCLLILLCDCQRIEFENGTLSSAQTNSKNLFDEMMMNGTAFD